MRPRVIERQDLLVTLRKSSLDVLKSYLDSDSSCVLLGFPSHSNPGDSSIWLGEKEYLRSMNISVSYSCDLNTYSRRRVCDKLDGGTILLHGGGNLGDIWMHQQRFKERVISAFPNSRIIQLPQSIFFRKRSNLARTKTVFDKHRDLTIMVRDEQSLQVAHDEFRASTVLCPDMAFGLGALDDLSMPVVDIIWLSRTDKESAARLLPPVSKGFQRRDWPTDSLPIFPLRLLHRRIGAALSYFSFPQTIYDRLATKRLARGILMLSMGRVVITDRLHGHILSLLLGIPHILLDNSYGKIRSFYMTWTKRSILTHWAESPSHALMLGREILAA